MVGAGRWILRITRKTSRIVHRDLKGIESIGIDEKAYLMREDFHRVRTYTSPGWASKFLREWCTRASQSRIEPMQKIAKMLRKHERLLLNWFESQGVSSGVVEGFNNKAKLTMRKAYGFKDPGASARPATVATWHRPPPTSPITSS
ncbi:MAG: transposase, partial [Planctomycetes bacterium]|nr:transposase [Planctomycetota bacterium]